MAKTVTFLDSRYELFVLPKQEVKWKCIVIYQRGK